MSARLLQPAAAARRQLLHDRLTELAEAAGCAHPDALARQARDAMDELGFTLPPAITDPLPPPARSTAAGRAAARAHLAAALANRHQEPTP